MSKNWKEILKNLDVVLVISGILAVVSMIWNPPGKEYLEFIDVRVLCLLFALMAVIAGLSKEGVFAGLAGFLAEKAGNLKLLAYVLVGLCFFTSMFITNDVALITFVPMTIFMLAGYKQKHLIRIVVLETIAANLGSMLLPFGNPQNLYLYGRYQMSMGEFLKSMLLPWMVSLALLVVLIAVLIPGVPLLVADLEPPVEQASKEAANAGKLDDTVKKRTSAVAERRKHKRNIALYSFLFLFAIGGVLRFIPYYIVLLVVAIVFLIVEREILRRVDYGLLLTFVFFFIFVGNLSELELVRQGVQTFLEGRTVLAGALVSQIISNVPAALMLSGFTDEGVGLLLGVNIGGLGTLIASMASLISYKYYRSMEHSDGKGYFLCFTGLNFLLLVVLLIVFH